MWKCRKKDQKMNGRLCIRENSFEGFAIFRDLSAHQSFYIGSHFFEHFKLLLRQVILFSGILAKACNYFTWWFPSTIISWNESWITLPQSMISNTYFRLLQSGWVESFCFTFEQYFHLPVDTNRSSCDSSMDVMRCWYVRICFNRAKSNTGSFGQMFVTRVLVVYGSLRKIDLLPKLHHRHNY